MKPEFRIKKNENGKFEVYYVEKVKTFFGSRTKEVLKPYVTWSGLDKVFEFSTMEIAVDELKAEVIMFTELLNH
jgi:hypothetical protein